MRLTLYLSHFKFLAKKKSATTGKLNIVIRFEDFSHIYFCASTEITNGGFDIKECARDRCVFGGNKIERTSK